jgi:hypothetical protein
MGYVCGGSLADHVPICPSGLLSCCSLAKPGGKGRRVYIHKYLRLKIGRATRVYVQVICCIGAQDVQPQPPRK